MFDLNTLISAGPPLFLLRQHNFRGRSWVSRSKNTGRHLRFFGDPKSRKRDIASETPDHLGRTPKVVLPEKVRKLLQERLRFGLFGTRIGVRDESN
jgi:hypothetical protein